MWPKTLHKATRPSASPGPYSTIITSSNSCLNLNLAGNLDHIVGLQIESIDYFHGISIKKREQNQPPAAQAGVFSFGHHEIARSHEPRLVEIDRRGETVRARQRAAQIRNFQKTKACNDVPQAFSHRVHHSASGPDDTRRSFKHDAERTGIARQHAHEVGMVHDESGYFLGAARQENRRPLHARYDTALQIR